MGIRRDDGDPLRGAGALARLDRAGDLLLAEDLRPPDRLVAAQAFQEGDAGLGNAPARGVLHYYDKRAPRFVLSGVS